jgi:hypothetical protein
VIDVEALRLVRDFLFPDRVASHAIPTLDGGLVPNDALEAAETLLEVASPTTRSPRRTGPCW